MNNKDKALQKGLKENLEPKKEANKSLASLSTEKKSSVSLSTEEQEPQRKLEIKKEDQKKPEIHTPELFAFKKFMTTVFNEKREAIPVTYLKYEPWFVSQIKSKQKEGYDALQVACSSQSFKRGNKAKRGHLKNTHFENSARFLKEIQRGDSKKVQIGSQISLSSLKKGEKVKITARSKGRGFAGTMKRWKFGGGPASHGSRFHRRTGSIGNCTWPGRVMAGRKMPGRYGFQNHSVSSVEIVDVLLDESALLLKGPIPGAKNTLVKLKKLFTRK